MPIHDWTRVYAGLFHDFHQSWSIFIKNAMNAGLLPKGLTALVEQKVSTKETDVLTVDQLADGEADRGSGGTLLTMTAPATRIVRKSSKEFYSDLANRIVVKHQLGRTVAIVEIVSPGNKDSKRAFREFVEKSVAFIRAGVHVLVVDLFPPTKRDPFGVHRAIWDEFEDEDVLFEFPPGKDRTLASYDAGREKAAYVEPIALGEALPDMPLFLFEGHYIKVPLEAAYQTAWSFLPRELQVIVETGVMPAGAENSAGQ
ncbi:MAG: DUF4058 family protein [Planctomycetes bacterium]|nr:DUF4058 family protein [Planctomycetota bacterium]